MASATLTGTQMVKSKFIQGAIRKLTDGYTVTDAIFAEDRTDALSITYEDPTEKTPDASDQVEERNEMGTYPRIGMSTAEKSAMIRDYGLEIMISYNAIKYNKIDNISRAYTKLSNSVIKFVDSLGLQTLTDNYNTGSTSINTQAAGVAWSDAGAKPFNDLLLSADKVNSQPHGYNATVAVVNPSNITEAVLNDDFRKQLSEALTNEDKIVKSGAIKGKVAGLIIIASRNMREGFAWVGEPKVVGTRHENTNGVETDQYKVNNSTKSPTVVTAFREFVDTLQEPKAGTLLYGL